MTEDSRVKTGRNRADKYKSLNKEKRTCLKQEIDCCSICSNIKTVVEEYVSPENVHLHSADQ